MQNKEPGKQEHKSDIPLILYGTAWKEENTERLVFEALNLGFQGLDTANQRKHYFEEAVGFAVQKFLKNGQKTREELFLQTKFTSIHGQDARLPYDKSAILGSQVQQSFSSSLSHLKTDYIDSYILHGPTLSKGLIDADYEIWQAMENLVNAGKVKFLGISNINLQQLEEFHSKVSIKPTFVQNRCFANTLWDHDIRAFCKEHKLIYQGFSLLTANEPYILNTYLESLSEKYAKTIAQIVFRFALHIGILPLTGTCSLRHMQEDLNISDFELSTDEIHRIENLAN